MTASVKRRLFIGGLYSQVKEEDIRARFKSFGTISSVEIHHKDGHPGFPGKTFAYVDICGSEPSIRKCISVLSNANWKGSQIKVQHAKESFLARLEKERKGEITTKKPPRCPVPATLPQELIDPIKNTVPGTPVHGKADWVVGKFGRALPVVKMRPRGSKKLCKFDPSKTVHNLKRIREEGTEKSLEELTWEIEGEKRKSCEKRKKDKNEMREFTCDKKNRNNDQTTESTCEKKKRNNDQTTESTCGKRRRDNDKTSESAVQESDSNEENNNTNMIHMKISNIKGENKQGKDSTVALKGEHNHENEGSSVSLLSPKSKKSRKQLNEDSDTKSKSNMLFRFLTKDVESESDSSDDEIVINISNFTWDKKSEGNEMKGNSRNRLEESESQNDKIRVKCKVHCEDELAKCEQDTNGYESYKLGKLNESKRQKGVKKKTRDSDHSSDSEDTSIDSVKSCNENEECTEDSKNGKQTYEETAYSSTESEDSVRKVGGNTLSNSEAGQVDDWKKLTESQACTETKIVSDGGDSVFVNPGISSEKKRKNHANVVDDEINITLPSDNVDTTPDADNKKIKRKLKEKKSKIERDDNQNVIKSLTVNTEKKKKLKHDVEVSAEILNESISDNEPLDDDMKYIVKMKRSKFVKSTKKGDNDVDVLNGKCSEPDGKKENKTKNNNKGKTRKDDANERLKKADSNARRLDALKDRETAAANKKMVVASALKNIDIGTRSVEQPGHRIVFDDHDDDDDNDESDDQSLDHAKQAVGKISGSQASNWLGLDSASDSEEHPMPSSGDDDATFAPKPQFEGKKGEKLFKLQKSFHGDQRFKLDQRFVDSEDEESEEDVQVKNAIDSCYGDDAGTDDDVSRQLAKERDMSLSVLRELLGDDLDRRLDKPSLEPEIFRDSTSIRYDPSRDDHVAFEQQSKTESSPEPSVVPKTMPAVVEGTAAPEVTKEKYYDVNKASLVDIFGTKKIEVETASPFTFLSDKPMSEETEETPMEEEETLRVVPWKPARLPYDSSSEEDEGGDEVEDEGGGKGTTQQPRPIQEELFFFHPGNPELENRLEGEGCFVRRGSLEEIKARWVERRRELTQDYKKKHKDAVRRKNKMEIKKARFR